MLFWVFYRGRFSMSVRSGTRSSSTNFIWLLIRHGALTVLLGIYVKDRDVDTFDKITLFLWRMVAEGKLHPTIPTSLSAALENARISRDSTLTLIQRINWFICNFHTHLFPSYPPLSAFFSLWKWRRTYKKEKAYCQRKGRCNKLRKMMEGHR